MSRPLVLLAAACFAIIGLLPLLWMALRSGHADFEQLLDPRNLALLGRTLLLGLGAASLASAFALPFAWLVTRARLPLAPLWRVLGIVPLLFPPLILAMSWAGMTSLRGGWATTLIMALSTFPIPALFAARALERIDARRSDAARLAGGIPALLRVELGLALPSVLCGACFAFLFAINDFAVPDYVSSIGPKFNVYADEVFATWRSGNDTGQAVIAALPLILLTLLALATALVLRRRTRLESFDADFRAPAKVSLGPWTILGLGLVIALLSVSVCAPLGRLVWEAGGGARGFGWDPMQASFARAMELGRANLQSSLVYSLCAALLCVPLALVLGHALERSGPRGRYGALLVVLPLAVPAILLGIGCIALWNHAWSAAFYDSGAMVVVLMASRFASFAILAFSAATAMLDPRMEEAARLAGASPSKRLACIVAPPLLPALWGGATLVFVLSMREIDAAILVPAANSTILFRLYNAVHFGRDDFVAALALLVVFFVVLPGLLWTLFARRRLEILP